MFESVFPVLPALIVCHAWMTILVARTLSDDSLHVLSPECYPV